MFIHSIVYVVLLILSTTAAVASSMPIKRPHRSRQAQRPGKEPTDSQRG